MQSREEVNAGKAIPTARLRVRQGGRSKLDTTTLGRRQVAAAPWQLSRNLGKGWLLQPTQGAPHLLRGTARAPVTNMSTKKSAQPRWLACRHGGKWGEW